MQLPVSVKHILDELQARGYEAYAVGGCVRDALLGREPEDWDVTTSAEPEEVKAIFPVTIDTGIEHGTVTVRHNKTNYEITTFRTDGEYTDHRHPEEVHFAKTLEEDLLRRDFTINAMAYCEGAATNARDDGDNDAKTESGSGAKRGLVDLYGGQQDLADGIIRCVGDPRERFEEDALRILRAFRFAAQLSDTLTLNQGSEGEGAQASDRAKVFKIEPATREAIRDCREGLRYISAERIQVEMTKILTSAHPDILRDMYELGVTQIILPEIDAMMETEQHFVHHDKTVGEHTLAALMALAEKGQNDKALGWTMLLHDSGKPRCKVTDEDGQDHFKGHAAVSTEIAGDVMNRMKMDNATRDRVKRLVYHHDYRMLIEKKDGDYDRASYRRVRRALNKIGEEYFDDYCLVRRADILAQSMYMREEKLANVAAVEEIYHRILEEQDCVSLKDLAVTGQDLIAEGVTPGPEIGDILKEMLDWVLDDPELNDRETLLARWKATQQAK